MSLYDLEYQSIEGANIPLSSYKGNVIILVNTASKCGFTPQYEGLETLYKTYKDNGLTIIGFPCNQFMEQEPGGAEEIQEFCKVRYGVTFPLSEKIDVNGESAHPIFQYLTANTEFKGLGKGLKSKSLELMLKAKYGKAYADSSIKWNFTKFLIDREGNIVGRFEPTTTPEEMESTIKEYL